MGPLRREPSELLNAEIKRVKTKANDVLREYVGRAENPEDDYYATALSAIESMELQTQNSIYDNLSIIALEAALREFLNCIEQEQQYANKVGKDAARYRLWWFKLHAGGMLEQTPQIERGYIIELLTELSNNGRHESGMTGDSDPVIVSTLVYLWRVVYTILDYWEDLIPYSEFNFISSDLVPDEGHVGFIRKLDREVGEGEITSYQQGGREAGIAFDHSHVEFFPTTGDLVHVIGNEPLPNYAGTIVRVEKVQQVRLL